MDIRILERMFSFFSLVGFICNWKEDLAIISQVIPQENKTNCSLVVHVFLCVAYSMFD